MQSTRYVFSRLVKACQSIHAKRLLSLRVAVDSLAVGQRLTVTGLGRSLRSRAKVKHDIKRMDRLVGNKKLFAECELMYRVVADWVIGSVTRPLIIVDWTELTWNRTFHLLRAAVPVGGRAITIYEEVHPTNALGNDRVHRRFLGNLAKILADSCKPILVTDAGFRGPWFQAVEAQGWDWVGRVRNRTLVREVKKTAWDRAKSLYSKASRNPKALGRFEIAKSNPRDCFLYLVRAKKRGRVRKTTRGTRSKANASVKIARREREPWLLASSLPNSAGMAKEVVRFYRQRMQIEESFRDMKNQRCGFSLRDSRTQNAARLAILMLINTLAHLALWITGLAGQARSLHYELQANTVRSHNVLSTFFVGCQLVLHHVQFYEREIVQAFRKLNIAAHASGAPC